MGLLCLLVMGLYILSFLLNVFSQTGQDGFMLTEGELKKKANVTHLYRLAPS